MSDPKYNTYAGELRFDDDNIVDVNLEPDTENITVKLNGVEITSGGSDLPEVDSGDNGKVLTVVEGEWAAATPAAPPAELPAVTSSDNGDVLTVVEGAWAKAALPGRVLYGLAAVSTDPTVDLPSDVPAAPTGFVWYPNNAYTLVNLQTQTLITLEELSTLNFDNMEMREDVHEDSYSAENRAISIPVNMFNCNDYDPENPAADQSIGKMLLFEPTQGEYISAGWQLVLQEENA